MGGKSKSNPAPVAAPTPQVQTPDVDVAQLAAKKALDAREGAVTATNAETEDNAQKKQQPNAGLAATQPRPKRQRDPATGMAPAGGMQTAAVLTG